jgi:hypothetical protein
MAQEELEEWGMRLMAVPTLDLSAGASAGDGSSGSTGGTTAAAGIRNGSTGGRLGILTRAMFCRRVRQCQVQQLEQANGIRAGAGPGAGAAVSRLAASPGDESNGEGDGSNYEDDDFASEDEAVAGGGAERVGGGAGGGEAKVNGKLKHRYEIGTASSNLKVGYR